MRLWNSKKMPSDLVGSLAANSPSRPHALVGGGIGDLAHAQRIVEEVVRARARWMRLSIMPGNLRGTRICFQ